jgi:hypothetical protein
MGKEEERHASQHKRSSGTASRTMMGAIDRRATQAQVFFGESSGMAAWLAIHTHLLLVL